MQANLSLSQRIHNAKTSAEAEKLKAYHGYTHGAARSAEEWGYIWSRKDDIAWGHVHGRQRGFVHMWYGSVISYDWMGYLGYAHNLLNEYPQIAGRDPRPFMGLAFHPLCSGVIEVAEDGQTCRAYYYTPGMMVNYFGGKWGNMLWERYGADFRYEDGKLLYIHEQVQPDFMDGDMDISNFAHDDWMIKCGKKELPPMEPPPFDLKDGLHAIWTDPGPLFLRSSITTPVQTGFTEPPTPYKTFTNKTTYATHESYPDE
jgi:hypothetical protein